MTPATASRIVLALQILRAVLLAVAMSVACRIVYEMAIGRPNPAADPLPDAGAPTPLPITHWDVLRADAMPLAARYTCEAPGCVKHEVHIIYDTGTDCGKHAGAALAWSTAQEFCWATNFDVPNKPSDWVCQRFTGAPYAMNSKERAR